MKSKVFIALCALGLILGAPGANAQTRELVGISNDLAPAPDGILAMHRACSESYRGSKMCSSADIMLNGASDNAVLTPPVKAFINPVFVAGREEPSVSGNVQVVVDYSGYSATLPTDMNCSFWNTTFSDVSGLGMSLVPGAAGSVPSLVILPFSCIGAQQDTYVACCCTVGEKCPAFFGRFGTVSPPFGELP